MKKMLKMILSLAVLSFVISGCGKTPEETVASDSEWPRKFQDAAGHEVVLEKQPQRIAILHSMYLEYFFTLETPPTASAGANTGTAMKALEEFETLRPFKGTADIIDLGSARQLNLEAILASEPDVIVTFAGHGGVNEIYDQLTKIAPVVLLDYSATWQDSIRDCARIVGKEKLAEQRIGETEKVMSEAREQLAALGDKTVIFVRSDGKGGVFSLGTVRYPYYYDKSSGFGLSVPEGYPDDWGVISLETLSELDPDYIIFQDFKSDAEGLVKTLKASSVWNHLKAVKNQQVIYLDGSLNTTSPLAIQAAAKGLTHFLGK